MTAKKKSKYSKPPPPKREYSFLPPEYSIDTSKYKLTGDVIWPEVAKFEEIDANSKIVEHKAREFSRSEVMLIAAFTTVALAYSTLVVYLLLK